jgi:hypothetical protein
MRGTAYTWRASILLLAKRFEASKREHPLLYDSSYTGARKSPTENHGVFVKTSAMTQAYEKSVSNHSALPVMRARRSCIRVESLTRGQTPQFPRPVHKSQSPPRPR